jgi:WD40 repeat protein
MDDVTELLRPHGKGLLESVIGTMSTRMQELDPEFSLSHLADLVNTEVGKEAARHKREQQQQLKKGICALAVVVGARPARNGGGASDFRLGAALGKGRSGTGLLHAGGDILQLVAGFLSWGVELQRNWMAHEGKHVTECHFSPDGHFILTCSWDHTLRLWSVASGELLQTFEGHSDYVLCCRFDLDGKFIVSGSRDHTLKVWDRASGALLNTLVGHAHPVVGCGLAGASMLSGSLDGTLKLWAAPAAAPSIDGSRPHVKPYDLLRTANVGCNVSFFCLSGNDYHISPVRILVACYDAKLRLFDAATFELLHIFQHGHEQPGIGIIFTCGFSPDGNTIVSGGAWRQAKAWTEDSTMKLWSATTGQLLRTLVGHSGIVQKCIFSPDGQTILSTSHDKTVMLWEAGTGRLRRIVDEHTSYAPACRFTPDGKSVLAGFSDGVVKMWREGGGRVRNPLQHHKSLKNEAK